MKKIRSLLMIISFAVFGISSLFVGAIVFPIIKLFVKDVNKRLDIFSEIVYRSWNMFVKLVRFIKLIRLGVEDIKKMESIKNSVIVSTHPSYIDVLIILSLIPKTTCYVAPRLAENKFFKNIVESMFLISGKPLEELKKDSFYMFEHGFNVLIFPSGIRHKKNEQPKIRKGASMIALNAKKDVVPVIMSTNFDFLQIGQSFCDAGSETVIYDIKCGETIKIDEFLKNDDEVSQRRFLTEKIKKSLYEL